MLSDLIIICDKDFKEEIQSIITNENIKVVYLYKVGWIDYPNTQLPYFRIGKLIKN